MQLLGEFECKVDSKGRMRLPSNLIAQLGKAASHEFVINRGFEKCLMLYPRSVWERISKEVDQLNVYSRKQRQFIRYFYRGAHPVSLDSNDRLLITRRLMEYAGVNKEVILSAYNDRIEIWAKERYDSLLEEEPEDFSDLAEEVLGGGSTSLFDEE